MQVQKGIEGLEPASPFRTFSIREVMCFKRKQYNLIFRLRRLEPWRFPRPVVRFRVGACEFSSRGPWDKIANFPRLGGKILRGASSASAPVINSKSSTVLLKDCFFTTDHNGSRNKPFRRCGDPRTRLKNSTVYHTVASLARQAQHRNQTSDAAEREKSAAYSNMGNSRSKLWPRRRTAIRSISFGAGLVVTKLPSTTNCSNTRSVALQSPTPRTVRKGAAADHYPESYRTAVELSN